MSLIHLSLYKHLSLYITTISIFTLIQSMLFYILMKQLLITSCTKAFLQMDSEILKKYLSIHFYMSHNKKRLIKMIYMDDNKKKYISDKTLTILISNPLL